MIDIANSEKRANDLGEVSAEVITIFRAHVDEMFAHALRVLPEECCGLVGWTGNSSTCVYPLRNTASNARVRYEASPSELFSAQKQMRSRGEELLAIYHSHPHDAEPVPSETDVRLAFYPHAIYFIIGFSTERNPVLRAFNINAEQERWTAIEFRIE